MAPQSNPDFSFSMSQGIGQKSMQYLAEILSIRLNVECGSNVIIQFTPDIGRQ